MTEPQELLCYSPGYVAEHAGCAVQTIYRLLEEDTAKPDTEKSFPGAFRIGSKWMVPEDAALKWLGHDPSKVKVRLVK